MFTDLLDGVLVEHGTVSQYLSTKMCTKDAAVEFMRWMDLEFPASDDKQYAVANDLKREGAVFLRPWHLPWGAQCGLKGVVETEIVRQIGQLICLHGFTTNPEKPGVECLVVTRPRPEIGMASDFQFHPRDIADEDGRDHMLEPHGVVFCKGWTRAFIFITVMRLCYDHPNLKEVISPEQLQSFGTIYATVSDIGKDASSLVATNRHITLAASVRRRPNAFNLYFQLKFLHKVGTAENVERAWTRAADLAEAYQIGKWESQAAFRLLNDVPDVIVQRLMGQVQRFSMGKFLTHEAVAEGVFNDDFCSATSSMVAWQADLLNSDQVLHLLCDRLSNDFLCTPLKFRKPWNFQQVEGLQRVCAAFLACLRQFESTYPEEYVRKEADGLVKGFMSRLADADLLALLSNSVPPVDLQRVALFRAACKKHDKQVEEANAAAQESLALQMQTASVQQTETTALDDIQRMKDWLDRAQDHANRQVNDVGGLAPAHQELLKFQTGQGDDGDASTLIIIDASLWPSRAQAIDEACEAARSICMTNANAAVFCMYPIPHTSLERSTCVGHRRVLEDRLMQTMELHDVALQFKESQHANDKRKKVQPCAIGISQLHNKSSAFAKSKAVLTGQVGPCCRARVSDLLSLDADRPAGPSQRVQQRGVDGTKELLEALAEGLDENARKRIYVLDLLPNRFSEWSRAAWALQLKYLVTPSGLDWRYLGYLSQDDADLYGLTEIQNSLTGCMMKEYWDTCADAGPPKRVSAAFEEPMPQLKTLARDGKQLKLPTSVRELLGSKADGIADKISELNADRGGLQVVVAGTPTASGPPTPRGADHPEGSRTLCRPVFEADDRPINASRVVANFEHLSQQEFELTKVIKVACKTSHESVQVALVQGRPLELWLTNFEASVTADVGPMELFGFNVGSFQEKPTGTAQSLCDYLLPFKIQSDTAPFVVVGAGNGKTISCLSNLACDSTRTSGLTELTLEGHDVTAKVKEDGTMAPFRYHVKHRPMVTCFEPKQLQPSSEGGGMLIRASMFGAALLPAPLSKGPLSQSRIQSRTLASPSCQSRIAASLMGSQVGSHSGAERQAEVLVGLQDSVGAQHSHPSPVISLNFSE